MNDTRREILLGYLSNALEDDEMRLVGIELEKHEEYRADLSELQEEIAPVMEYARHCDRAYSPPSGLARRTCRAIWDNVDKQKSIASSYLSTHNVHVDIPSTSDKKKISVDIFTQPPPDEYDKTTIREYDRPAKVSTINPKPQTNSEVSKQTQTLTDKSQKKSFVRLPQIYSRPNIDQSKGEWRLSNLAVLVSVLVISVVVLIPVAQITGGHVVKLYKRNVIKKMGQKNAVIAQYNLPVDHNPTNPDLEFRTGRDIGSFLSAFREVNLNQAILANPIPTNQSRLTQPRFVNNQPSSLRRATVSYVPTVSDVSSADSLLPLLNTKTVSQSPGIPFAEWEHSCTSVLSDGDSGTSPNCEFNLCEEPGVMYRDGNVLFRQKSK